MGEGGPKRKVRARGNRGGRASEGPHPSPRPPPSLPPIITAPSPSLLHTARVPFPLLLHTSHTSPSPPTVSSGPCIPLPHTHCHRALTSPGLIHSHRCPPAPIAPPLSHNGDVAVWQQQKLFQDISSLFPSPIPTLPSTTYRVHQPVHLPPYASSTTYRVHQATRPPHNRDGARTQRDKLCQDMFILFPLPIPTFTLNHLPCPPSHLSPAPWGCCCIAATEAVSGTYPPSFSHPFPPCPPAPTVSTRPPVSRTMGMVP